MASVLYCGRVSLNGDGVTKQAGLKFYDDMFDELLKCVQHRTGHYLSHFEMPLHPGTAALRRLDQSAGR